LQNEYRRRADSLEDSLADKRKSKQKSNLNEQSIGDRLDHERFLARSAVPFPRMGIVRNNQRDCDRSQMPDRLMCGRELIIVGVFICIAPFCGTKFRFFAAHDLV
jgi:hypothetical protein